jgi:transcriptional regulator with XRE-family HTH domain
MSNIVTGRQLRAARILAGLTQKELAKAVGVHERAARYWESKEDEVPTSTLSLLVKTESVLRDNGVIVFATPTAGVRLVAEIAGEGVIRTRVGGASKQAGTQQKFEKSRQPISATLREVALLVGRGSVGESARSKKEGSVPSGRALRSAISVRFCKP